MQPILIVMKGQNYLLQTARANSQQVVLRLNDTKDNSITTHAELVRMGDGSWCYSLEERANVWGRGSSISNSTALSPDEALEDMLAFIRSFNYDTPHSVSFT